MSYQLGQPVPLSALVYDADGALANATTVTLTITLPDGTTATPAVTNPPVATGTYTYTYTPTLPGLHGVSWVFTGANASAPPLDSFTVNPATGFPLVSLADLRAHLNWPATKGTADDAELLGIAESATGIIGSHIGRPLRRTVVTGELHGCGPSIRLRQVPCACSACAMFRVLTVSSVAVDGVTVPSSDYFVDSILGKIVRKPPMPWVAVDPLGISVNYATGYTAPPPWLSLAEKRLVEHLWTRTQQARHQRAGNVPAESQPAPAFLLPYAVESLIQPHGYEVLVA